MSTTTALDLPVLRELADYDASIPDDLLERVIADDDELAAPLESFVLDAPRALAEANAVLDEEPFDVDSPVLERLSHTRDLLFHAWHLLGEVAPPRGLEALLGVLRLPDDMLQDIFDFTFEYEGWVPLARLGGDHVAELAAVLADEDRGPLAQRVVAGSLVAIAFHRAERRAEAVAALRAFLAREAVRAPEPAARGAGDASDPGDHGSPADRDDDGERGEGEGVACSVCGGVHDDAGHVEHGALRRSTMLALVLNDVRAARLDELREEGLALIEAGRADPDLALDWASPPSDDEPDPEGLFDMGLLATYERMRDLLRDTDDFDDEGGGDPDGDALGLDGDGDDEGADALDPLDAHAPEEPYRRAAPKVGRNEPCPCGSGKKHKKCCGAT